METIPAHSDRAVDYKEYRLEIRDPYGFVYIKPHMGRCPAELAGVFTSWQYAKEAVDLYLEQNPKRVEEKKERAEKKVDG